ncbi:MAG: hypothetical protein SVR81_03005 [Chloroflexota bacterium]|nr:hypothetical protein [Chloroflexota bacterium]
MLNAAALVLPSLLSLAFYQNLGGLLPLAGLSVSDLLPALSAVLVYAFSYFLVWLPFVIYVVWVQRSKFGADEDRGLFWFTVATMELPFVSLPLGVLASGLYIVHGSFVLGIYFLGLMFIALLASQLSRSAAQSRRHIVQLMGLEQLGRAILAGYVPLPPGRGLVGARDLSAALPGRERSLHPRHLALAYGAGKSDRLPEE